jgi:hypothetical protein
VKRFLLSARVRTSPDAPPSLIPRYRGVQGTVVGFARDEIGIRVQWDHRKTVQVWHPSFLVQVRA